MTPVNNVSIPHLELQSAQMCALQESYEENNFHDAYINMSGLLIFLNSFLSLKGQDLAYNMKNNINTSSKEIFAQIIVLLQI